MSDPAAADDFEPGFFLAYARDEQFNAFWRSKRGDTSYVEWNRTATSEELAALLGEWATLAARSELTPWEGSSHEDVAFEIARDAATMGRLALGHTRERSADDPTTWRIDRYWGIHDSATTRMAPAPNDTER
jgi:hypothetical protein